MELIYIPPTKPVADVVAHLRAEYEQCANIKSKRTRTNVKGRSDPFWPGWQTSMCRRPGSRSSAYHRPGSSGTAGMPYRDAAGHRSDGLYRCVSTFDLQPLRAMQNDIATYGLLVIDTADAAIDLAGNPDRAGRGVLRQVPRETQSGGTVGATVRTVTGDCNPRILQKVADAATALFTTMDGFPGRFKGLIVGGLSPSKDRFVNHGYLPRTAGPIVGVVDVPLHDGDRAL